MHHIRTLIQIGRILFSHRIFSACVSLSFSAGVSTDFPAGFLTVFRWFSDGFPDGFPGVLRRCFRSFDSTAGPRLLVPTETENGACRRRIPGNHEAMGV